MDYDNDDPSTIPDPGRDRAVEAFTKHRAAEDGRVEAVGKAWVALIGGHFGKTNARSVRTFLRLLPFEEVLDAVAITSDGPSRSWRYFYGVCWRKIRRASGKKV